ncbi:hypothetical protein L345_18404, partial [Ophiophagus hannah]
MNEIGREKKRRGRKDTNFRRFFEAAQQSRAGLQGISEVI